MTNFSIAARSVRCAGAVEEVFLGDGQHAAGSACGIVDGDVPFRNGNFQQFDHESDDFARREVVSGLFSALF